MKTSIQNPFRKAASLLGKNICLALVSGILGFSSSHAATETFNTQGTFDWVCPPGITVIQIECWGGGGAGGAGRKDNQTSTNSVQNGGGGGGGGYARRGSVPVTPGQTYTITIPPAAISGTNGTTTNGQGRVNGGTVTFVGEGGITVSAAGGTGGANAYINGSNTPAAAGGGAGGSGTQGDVVFSGGAGANGTTGGGNVSGGGGGGAGDSANGGAGQGGNNTPAAGGTGGINGGGNGGNGVTGATTAGSQGPGGPGQTPGGGGGGGHNLGQATQLGGTGGLGQIVLTYEFPVSAVKADNTNDLNLGSSWVGGELPNSVGNATWNSTVTTANTTSLGGDLTFGGLVIVDPAGPVTINPGNSLTLGTALVNIDLSAATQNLTLNCDLAMGGTNVWDIASGRTLTLGGIVSGSGLTIDGSGTTIFEGANTFIGGLTVSGGTLKLAASEVIPHGAGTGNVTLNGTLDLNGFDEQINGLSGAGVVDNTATDTDSVLTIGTNNQAGNFSGTLQNSGSGATLALTKNGTGALTLGGASSHSGLTTINGGAVTIQNGGALGTTAAGTVVNGTGTGNAANARLDLSGGITVAGEALTISGVGAFFGALGSANGNNEWTGNVTVAAPGTRLGAVATATLKVSGVVDSGVEPHGLVIRTANITDSTVILAGANTYLGDTWVAVGKLQLDGGNNRLPVGTKITIGAGTNVGEFDLNGANQEIAALEINAGATAANNSVNNSSGTLSTLTVNTASPSAFAGILKGNLALTKSGSSTLTLTGANTNTGATNVTAGTLLLSTAGSGVSDINVSAGASAGALVAANDALFFNLGDLTLGTNSILTIDYGTTNPSTTTAPMDVEDFTVGTDLSLLIKGSNLSGLVVGQSYPLVTWVGIGPADGSAFTTVLNPRLQGTFSVSGKTLLFNVTANTGGDPIAWNTGNGTWNTNTANWLDANLAATTFFDAFDAVLFGDAAGVTGNPVVTLDSALSPTAVVMNSADHDYTLSGAGSIGGNASLTLAPANTRTLTVLNANTFTGTTAVNGGTLVLGNGGTDGALPAASPISIGSGATFTVNQSDTVTQGTDFGAAAITGAGGFTQAGGGTTILNAANTYSGQTVVSSGTLQATVSTTGNGVGSSAVSIASGTTLLFDNTSTSGTTAISNTFTGNGLLKVQFAANTTARNTTMANVAGFAGTIQLSSPDVTGDKWNATGVGTVTGSLIIDAGNTILVSSGTTNFSGGITLGGPGNTENRGAIRVGGATTVFGGNMTLTSDTRISMENVAAQITGNITSGAAGTQIITLGGTGSIGGILSGSIGGGTGTIGIETAVAGTYTLSGNSSYSGGTSLNAGIINVNHSNALGTGTASVNGGIRYVIGNAVDVPNAFVLGPNAGVVGFGLINVATGNTGTVSGPITINNGASAGGHFATQGTGVLNLTGVITSSVTITHRIGTTVLSGGGTGYESLINGQGTIRLGADNGIATTATMSIGNSGAATLDLAGFNQTMAGITKGAQAATIGNSSTTSDSTLTTTGTSTFAGVVQDVIAPGTRKVALAVASGELTLSGANTYTGTTTVSAGTLALGANNVLPDASNVIVGAGTLDAATFTDTAGTLAVTAAATINLGTGGTLAFADSSAVDWTGGVLNITGAFVSGSSIRFGTTAAGLTTGQLDVITVNGTGTYTLDADGFLIESGGLAGYALWASTNAPTGTPGDDFDGDSVSNALEYVLGGTKDSNDLGKLPVVTASGGNLLFTFVRDQVSIDGSTTVQIEVGTNLVNWPATYTVGADTAGSTTGVTVTKNSPSAGRDSVTLTVPQALDAQKFARLKVTVAP